MAASHEHASSGPPRASLAYVVDDEVQIGALVCRVFAACGFTPRQFTSAPPFLAELKTSPPDVIALDLALGQCDAVEIIRHLESQNYRGKVVLISGRGEETLVEVTRIGERHGLIMLPPLAKPFHIGDLKERLASCGQDLGAAGAPARKGPAVRLWEALHNNWLELWYQPKVDLKTLMVCGAEALIRARHPEHGIVSPVDLLPPAGDPTYQPMSKFVFRRAMIDWTVIADRAIPLKLSVNMPMSVVRTPDFISIVRRYLPADPRFPGLIVEVTEDEIVRDRQRIREVATQLKLYNIQLSIDDFGSACAALSKLNDLPFSEVKIDRNFVLDCAVDTLKHSLCQTVIDLAHRFGATVCAEGVEKAEDLRALITIGCDTAQGFLFAKPMSFDQFLNMLVNRGESGMRFQEVAGSGVQLVRLA